VREADVDVDGFEVEVTGGGVEDGTRVEDGTGVEDTSGGSPKASTQYDFPVTKLPHVAVMEGFWK
jgi:hypothetical protein